MSDYIFDLDGTIYSGEFAYLSMVSMASNLPADKVWFLSNSDRIGGGQIFQRLTGMGINVYDSFHVLTAQDIARDWVKNQQASYRVWAPSASSRLLVDGKEVNLEVGNLNQECDKILLCLEGVEALVSRHGEKKISDMLRDNGADIVAMNLDRWVSRGGTKKLGLGGWMDILDAPAPLVENLGKPSELGASILAERGLVIEDSVVIGDNVDTDGALARAIGADFLLFHAHQDGK